MTKRLRKAPEPGNLRADQNWYRPDGDGVSWHFLREWNRDSTAAKMVCGLVIDAPIVSTDALPRGKSCETCLRYDARASVGEVPELPPPSQPEAPAGG